MKNKIKYILTALILISNPNICANSKEPEGKNEFKIKKIDEQNFIISYIRRSDFNFFRNIKLDAACAINTSDNIQTEYCLLNLINKKDERFLSHRFKYRKNNNTIELTIKDSRGLSIYRDSFSNEENWIPTWMLNPYLNFLVSRNIKEQKVLTIDENGFSEVIILKDEDIPQPDPLAESQALGV